MNEAQVKELATLLSHWEVIPVLVREAYYTGKKDIIRVGQADVNEFITKLHKVTDTYYVGHGYTYTVETRLRRKEVI